MATRNDIPDDASCEAPRPLTASLRAMHTHDLAVPTDVDRAILDAARQQFAVRRRWRWVHTAAAVTAAAAAVAIAFTFWSADRSGSIVSTTSVGAVSAQPADVDGSGRVDILDAFHLARQLKSTQGERPDQWDINHDGQVDADDVDAIAAAAVAVHAG